MDEAGNVEPATDLTRVAGQVDAGSRPLLIGPGVPDQIRPAVRAAAPHFDREPGTRPLALADGTGRGLLYSIVAGVFMVLVLAGIRQIGKDNGFSLPEWLPLVVGPAVPVLAILAIAGFSLHDAVHETRTGRLARRWSTHVITAAQQRAAAQAYPQEIGLRLHRVNTAVEHLHRSHDDLLRDGWLPGLTPATVDDLHYAVVRDLLATQPLRTTITQAASRPALEAQTVAARHQLAAADAAIDTQLDQLDQLCEAADAIAEGRRDLELADKLSQAHGELDLRYRLPAGGTDLPALACAARGVADLVRDVIRPANAPREASIDPPAGESQ
jgi:hypothetical protein